MIKIYSGQVQYTNKGRSNQGEIGQKWRLRSQDGNLLYVAGDDKKKGKAKRITTAIWISVEMRLMTGQSSDMMERERMERKWIVGSTV